MTNEQIIKALECCKNDDCDNCPNTFGNCYANLAGEALDLINRQQTEIEKMKVRIDAFDKAFDEVFPPEMIEKAKGMVGADNG